MNYIVTGGAGFIGSHLSEQLVKEKNKVIVIDDLSTGFESNLITHPDLQLIVKKVQDLPVDQFNDLSGIFHLAAQTSVPLSVEEFHSSSLNNLQSTLWVFELARQLNIPLVYASSSAIYGNLPMGDDSIDKFEILSPYAQDKLTQEHYAEMCFNLYKINSVGLRFFNVYGPKQDPKSPYSGVISIFLDKFMNKEDVIINGGYQTRDFIYVNDIVETIIKSMNILRNDNKCVAVNVGTGTSISIDTLYKKFVDIFKYEPRVIYKPLDKSDPERSDGKFEILKKELNIDYTNFTKVEEGLRNTVNYYLNNE